jgi:hypothetical protein
MYRSFFKTFLVLAGIICATQIVSAFDASSTSFILRDAVVGAGGVYQSSTSFQMFSGSDPVLTQGGLTSASFNGRYGFLYYPYIQAGALTGVLNGSAVDLSWVASEASVGLNVSGYETGIGTAPGGPYSYTNVSNVVSYSYTGLTPDVYYFVVRTLDGLGNVIAVSNEEEVEVPQVISFSVTDTTIGFGSLVSSSSRYATGDTTGSSSETEAHQLVADTNAPNGYSVSVRGNPLTASGNTIDPIGGTNVSPVTGTEQFGIRLTATGGAGTVENPYSGSGFAFDATTTVSDLIAGAVSGTGVPTTYSVRYVSNIDTVTQAGAYASTLTYVMTANY